ncbi:MAG: DNA mismatch repair protein MutS [Parcubacteria group bacterium]
MPDLTPMLKQYKDIKDNHPNELLLFRLGDFYEMFGEDAKKASRILDIVLTARHKGTPHETPMCGVPHHALENYLAKLLKAGVRVAICDQVSDPSLPGLVKREVIRVVTPGTTLDSLNSKNNNFILSLFLQKQTFGLAVADLTTGEFKAAETADLQLLKDEIFRLNPSEVIIPVDLCNNIDYRDFIGSLKNVNAFQLPAFEQAYVVLTRHFLLKNLQSFGIENLQAGIEAAGNLFGYLKETQKTNLKHIAKITRYNFKDFMALDEATIRNLELFENQSTAGYEGSLLSVIDRTLTNQGGRLLRRWLAMPLLKIEEINERLSAIKEMKSDHLFMKNLAENLKQMADLQRLIGRIGCRRANARDLVALKNSLKLIPQIKSLLENKNASLLNKFFVQLPELGELVDLLENVFIDEPPAMTNEGGMVKDGYNDQLDELRQISRNAKDWMASFQAKEVERTGISSLKVRFNNVFGYYIEISNSNLDQAPLDYTRKQTLANAERFITPELKEYEEKILGAEEKIFNIEYQIFAETIEKTEKYFNGIQISADIVAALDVLLNFARVAEENNYCCPVVDASGAVSVKNGRHPVIERYQSDRYVPNDLLLDHEKNEFILLTGPNMSGKSSFLRQTALVSLMAQIGCFVPADEARLGIVDKIFTRVGASDNLAQGVSTFMAEMQEAANILNNATRNSLVILDELGRGTSTYDGVSIAWAIIEHIHDKIGAKTIFATHYHELTAVVDKLSKAENYCVAVSENEGKVVFLHKIIKGATSESYGIEVARLAGLPQNLLERSREILESLEKRKEIKMTSTDGIAAQIPLPLVIPEGQGKLANEISNLKVEEMTPLEALQKLADLKKNLADKH